MASHFIKFPGSISDRLDNTWIYVSNEEWPTTDDSNSICSKIIDGQFAIVSKECDYGNQPPPRRGRYVMLKREAGAPEDRVLHLCEVEIFSCTIGHWGIGDLNSLDDCSMQCHCKGNNTCRVRDGYCYSECEDTWWGLRVTDRVSVPLEVSAIKTLETVDQKAVKRATGDTESVPLVSQVILIKNN